MIKARAGNTVVIGLSDMNIIKLRDGQPIMFNMSAIGFEPMDFLLFNARTSEELLQLTGQHITIEPDGVYTGSKADYSLIFIGLADGVMDVIADEKIISVKIKVSDTEERQVKIFSRKTEEDLYMAIRNDISPDTKLKGDLPNIRN